MHNCLVQNIAIELLKAVHLSVGSQKVYHAFAIF